MNMNIRDPGRDIKYLLSTLIGAVRLYVCFVSHMAGWPTNWMASAGWDGMDVQMYSLHNLQLHISM